MQPLFYYPTESSGNVRDISTSRLQNSLSGESLYPLTHRTFENSFPLKSSRCDSFMLSDFGVKQP